jgi:hypothetical protein
MSPLENFSLLQHILSFVGDNQYRFVALINKNFQDVYLRTFNYNKSTYYNASTVEHTDVCIDECFRTRTLRNATLCNSAVRHGNVWTLSYLHALGFRWDQNTCRTAAKYG